MPSFGVIVVRIFPHSGWIRRYTEYLCSVRMWENADRNNSEYGHFSRSLTVLLCYFKMVTFPEYIIYSANGTMYRVISSRSTAPYCLPQPLTAWKSKAQPHYHKAFLVLRKTNNWFYHYVVRYHFIIQYFDYKCLIYHFIRIVEKCILTNFLLVLSTFIPWVTLLLKFKL